MEPAHAVAASYGRMAFYYILKALDLPPGSEIILPALTFWVVPELARVAGPEGRLRRRRPGDVHASIPAALERAITPATRAVVPTHLYGLPCDMDAHPRRSPRATTCVVHRGLRARARRDLQGPAGRHASATPAFFSFQTLKPLNCYGGGLALVQRRGARRAGARARRRASRGRREARRRTGCWSAACSASSSSRGCSRSRVSRFCGCRRSSAPTPTCISGKKIRPLDPLPDAYTERFPNVQAAIGLAALDALDDWTEQTQPPRARHGPRARRAAGHHGAARAAGSHARLLPVLRLRPAARRAGRPLRAARHRHRDAARGRLQRPAICSPARRVEPPGAPGARRAAGAMQIPVYSTLTDAPGRARGSGGPRRSRRVRAAEFGHRVIWSSGHCCSIAQSLN